MKNGILKFTLYAVYRMLLDLRGIKSNHKKRARIPKIVEYKKAWKIVEKEGYKI